MKNLKLLLLLACLFSTTAFSQISQIKIVSFQVKNTLPSKIDEWNTVPAALILTVQKPPTVQLKEPKLVIQIRSNGVIICGSNISTASSIGSFDVKTFTTNELLGMLGNCTTLKEGSYQICVQFFNLDRIAISNEVCKDFKVETPKAEDYAPPTLITPETGKTISKKDILKPIMFRWTPLVPKPKEPVTYRLKVWQLVQVGHFNVNILLAVDAATNIYTVNFCIDVIIQYFKTIWLTVTIVSSNRFFFFV